MKSKKNNIKQRMLLQMGVTLKENELYYIILLHNRNDPFIDLIIATTESGVCNGWTEM